VKYPHPKGSKTTRPPASDLHWTSGLPDNAALDFMAPGGTLVLAPEAGVVRRFSGHDPATGIHGAGDVYGWSLYLHCAMGDYFVTHLGARYATLGAHVAEGQVLGAVGHWPHDEGRSHTHMGFTANAGRGESIKRIQAVRVAQKAGVLWPSH
jgi:murein DD-endopeptidase MepM/ murein hydrolase activator NlpD